MAQVDNIIIQVRARLQLLGIKLWLEPYYCEELGCVESEIEKLANSFSQELCMTIANCKLALTELQEGALRKLAARKEFDETGLATFNVRCVSSKKTIQNAVVEVKCVLNALGSELQAVVAKSLDIADPSRIKCISAGKIIEDEKSLEMQNIKNNQQLMVIVSNVEMETGQHHSDAMYDRIRKIKRDVESIVNSNRQLFEMEDQDGNTVFLPPDENRALLMALGYYEKARAAMKHDRYDEALVLLLEADDKFVTCNSTFLESVDNYALVNLDIVWCYLCLKNINQLPDAERRLDLCEKSFRRSYGDNLQRLITLKGSACAEKGLIMRLHLLQGVVLFHQNRRNEAYEKFVTAQTELDGLKVDDNLVATLVEMGYESFEARLALRSCSGNMEQAVNFIHERKEKIKESRKKSKKERQVNADLFSKNKQKDWVNPRSVCTLVEMGFEHDVVVEALKCSKNDVPKALDLLQTSGDELRRNLSQRRTVDDDILSQLLQLGYSGDMARIAVESTENNLEDAIQLLTKLCDRDAKSEEATDCMADAASGGPSTSAGSKHMQKEALKTALKEMECAKAYERFSEEISGNEQDYLDLTLVQEAQLLAEYKHLLE